MDIGHISIVHQNISWAYIRFHLKNKISNIALTETNVHINNAFVDAKIIILIDVLNLDVLDPFNDSDGKLNHLN